MIDTGELEVEEANEEEAGAGEERIIHEELLAVVMQENQGDLLQKGPEDGSRASSQITVQQLDAALDG